VKKTKSKNNLFPLLITALISLTGGLFIGVFSAEAVGDAYFPQDTDVALDVGTIVIIRILLLQFLLVRHLPLTHLIDCC
jgi:hypothetical protein